MDSFSTDSKQTRLLLEQARAGDYGALGRLFAQHRSDLRRMVALRLDPKLRQRVDPSDIVQEAQLEAMRRAEDYLARPAVPFRLWIRQIAYDRLIMMRRKHIKAKCRAVIRDLPLPDRSTVDLARKLLASASTPSRQLVRSELCRRVQEAMAQLSEPDREVLLMRNYERLSNQEVAQVLEIDPSAANKRYGRALLRLRAMLRRSGLTESGL